MPKRSYSTERSQVPWWKKDKTETSPVRLLLWTAVLGFLFGLIGVGQIAEDQIRNTRNKVHQQRASGDIVFIKVDDKSLAEIGRWPWPRRLHAELISKLDHLGAKRIFVDIIFEVKSERADDLALAAAVRNSGKVVLPVRGAPVVGSYKFDLHGPMQELRPGAQLATIGISYNYQNAIWHLPKALPFEGAPIPSMAAKLANVPPKSTGNFPVDYSVSAKSVPSVSASDVLRGRVSSAMLKGKDVVIGTDSGLLGDQFFVPGSGQMAGAYVHILGAETLKKGEPHEVGWLATLALAVALCALAIRLKSWRRQTLVLGCTTFALLAGPIPLEANLIFVDIAPSLFVAITIWGTLLWRHYRSDGLTNAVSGLPNLTAVRLNQQGRDQALVVGRFLNYAEIVASLPADTEKLLVDQIVSRLAVGSDGKTIYHGDGGIFAWFEEPQLPFGNHIDALHAMFRNPVRVSDLQLDLSVCFGVEIGSSRSAANRLASALASAEEASHDGLRWKIHDPEKLQNATWRLSILSKLDEAIDNGQVWVAYQPKLDLKTRTIVGAEALARWTHPEKGPIAASEFIPAAEQNDRIGKLTDFILDQAIASAAKVNGAGREFHMAVNLSARLLEDPEFESRLSALLIKHLLDPEMLTLELTETSAITRRDALQVLTNLRDLGVQISIDDYGTGLSTLDYLKKVPASEIKIDQSFIKGMLESRSDKVMVQSTIALAHSLNRTVVAEGVETNELLEALVQMRCDVAQGFIIGRPMPFDSLRRRLLTEQRRSVA